MNNDFFKQLLDKYRHRGILPDTNILVLWLVGLTNRSRIKKFNRTEKYTPADYDLLLRILNYFQKIVTTPNILTETYNLINQLGEPERGHCLKILAKNIDKFDEFYLASKIVTEEKQFIIYGLTDCGIVHLAKDQYLVLTDDLKLAHYLGKNNIDVINFNNIRELGWSNKKL